MNDFSLTRVSNINHLKAFIAGSSYPVMFLPLFVFGQMHRIHPIDLSNPNGVIRPLIIENMLIVPALYFGIWNMLFLWISNMYSKHRFSSIVRYGLGGATLGFFFATYGLIVHEMPTELYKLPANLQFVAPISAALVMSIIYILVQRPLNILFGIEAQDASKRYSANGESLRSWGAKIVCAGILFSGLPLVGMLIWSRYFPWQYTG
ncbi:hypothetical protein [Microbulbifer sp. 2205BS26-8]|uniref:hypothetical protein n=1 Tax=Microbulbifer sp. 2205BS26-8 TaxID=3064386 RepID=UPI00273EA949|nr:hypothetical protein [Microbulbifer sp. 2205BS26-8]MDP5210670.1 hypothetical protein [Microbulbifer sp. 2205BS26-8]